MQLERMEFRATNAEKESVLLKEQLKELRKRFDEVNTSSIIELLFALSKCHP